jgi:hypothetical protein
VPNLPMVVERTSTSLCSISRARIRLSRQTFASRISTIFCCDHLRGCTPRLGHMHRQFSSGQMFAVAGLARRLMRFICSSCVTSHRHAGYHRCRPFGQLRTCSLRSGHHGVRTMLNGQPLCKAAATHPLAPLISEPLALSLYALNLYQAIHGRPFIFVGLPSRRLVRRLS